MDRAYRLRAELRAVARTGDGRQILTIAPGSVVAVIGEPDGVGMVEVRHCNLIVAVFEIDLRERGDIVPAHGGLRQGHSSATELQPENVGGT